MTDSTIRITATQLHSLPTFLHIPGYIYNTIIVVRMFIGRDSVLHNVLFLQVIDHNYTQ